MNYNKITTNIATLLYKVNPSLLEKLYFGNENIILEPLLFAYFNSQKHNRFKDGTLIEIVQGYFEKQEPIYLKESYNEIGIAYVPNIGYFNKNLEKVDDLLYLDKLEILKEMHPLLHPYLYESYKGHITNPTPKYNSVYQKHLKTLNKALEIIKTHLPDFYQEFCFANKRIFIHDNPKILNFTTIETLGQLYFYATDDATLMYFIEELIHQGAHNILYHKTFPKSDYFKIDVSNTIMRDLTKQAWDYRDVYGAFHGVYTVFKRLESYEILIEKDIFFGENRHELYGRFADQFSRFRTGLELLPLDQVYTEKGKQLYLELDQKCNQILKKYEYVKYVFDLSFRDLDFNYTDFAKINDIKTFEEHFKTI